MKACRSVANFFKMWPEIWSLPAIIVVLVGFNVVVEASGLIEIYAFTHPDPSEQTMILQKIQFIPSAWALLLFCNCAAWMAIKFNRPDIWVMYKDIILDNKSSWEYPQLKSSLRYWYWRYFFASLISCIASLFFIV